MTSRVLVVDDNLALAENLADILGDEGFDATSVDSPYDAIDRAKQACFDCVVLDVRMPGMDGIELRERLRTSLPDAKFVFMTAYATDERLDAARRSGIAGILAKPFRPDALVSLLRGDARTRLA